MNINSPRGASSGRRVAESYTPKYSLVDYCAILHESYATSPGATSLGVLGSARRTCPIWLVPAVPHSGTLPDHGHAEPKWTPRWAVHRRGQDPHDPDPLQCLRYTSERLGLFAQRHRRSK